MFVLVPGWALAGRRTADLTGSVLALGVSFWVAVVTALAYMSAVRYAILLVVAVVGLVGAVRLKPKTSGSDIDLSEPLQVWDIFDRPRFALDHLMHRARVRVRGSWQAFLDHYGIVGVVLTIAALLWALVYGSWPWLHQVGPGTSDGYDNLLRIASLAGNTGVYSGGAAPTGVGALGAALSAAFFLPPLNVLRFLYPLADMFTVMAAGVLVHQLTRSGRAAAIVMFLVSVSSLAHLGFPVNFESPLALHWADILVLLACTEVMALSNSHERVHAVFAGLCLLGASLTSPPEAVAGLVIVGAIGIRRGRRVIWYGTLGVLLGLVPLAIGVLTHHPLNSNGWLDAGFPAIQPLWHNPNSPSYWVVWIAIAFAVINQFRPSLPPVRRLFASAVGGLGAVAAFLAWNSAVASIILWSGLLGILMVIVGVDTLLVLPSGGMRWGRFSDVAVAVLAIGGALLPSSAPVLAQYEPPLASAATLKIEESFPAFQWTVVAPVNQYSEVLSRGWHEELSLFVQTYPVSAAKSPQYRLKNDTRAPILTPNVFVFVEPRLYPNHAHVTRRDERLPIGSGNGAYTGQSLAAIESRAYYWALAYLKSHPRTATVYMRSQNLMVLWIRQ